VQGFRKESIQEESNIISIGNGPQTRPPQPASWRLGLASVRTEDTAFISSEYFSCGVEELSSDRSGRGHHVGGLSPSPRGSLCVGSSDPDLGMPASGPG